MDEEIQIIVIRRPTPGRVPDPSEIVRFFSQADPYTMSGRLPHELFRMPVRRPALAWHQDWRLYVCLASASAGVALGAMMYLLL